MKLSSPWSRPGLCLGHFNTFTSLGFKTISRLEGLKVARPLSRKSNLEVKPVISNGHLKGTALFSSRGTIGSYDVTGLCQAVIGRHLPMLVCDWPKFATLKVRPMRDQEASLAAWPTTTTHTDQHKICQIIC